MKNIIAVLAATAMLAASPAASAQNVTLYGLVDTGVEYIDNIGAGGDRIVRVPTLTGTFPSRWGLRGQEDLGGGLRAVMTIESGFAPDQGSSNQGGRLFGRQAFVGLSGSWGTLSLGRQYTATFWVLLDADLLGPNIYGSGSLDDYIPNARADNSVAYRGSFGGLTLGATYSVGRDLAPPGLCAGENAADRKACREYSGLLKYDGGAWGVAVAYDRLYGGAGALGGLTASTLTDDRLHVNGYVKLGSARLGAGLVRRDNGGNAATPRSDLWFLQAAYDITPTLSVDGGLFRLDVKDSRNGADLGVLRGIFRFSRRTHTYLTVGHIANDGASAFAVSGGSVSGTAPVAGESQTGVMAGLRHSF